MLDEIIRFRADLNPHATAVVTRRLSRTFAQFEADIRRAVHELRDFSVPPGEAAAVACGRAYLNWVVVMALARLGIACSAARDTKARYRVAVTEEEQAENLFLLTPDATDRISRGPPRAYFRNAPDPDALGAVFTTSGTTGTPKRVGVSWRAAEFNIGQIVATHANVPSPWLVATGMHTRFAFDYAVAAWASGKASIEGGMPAARSMLELKPGLLGMVPVQLQRVIDELSPSHAKWPLRIMTGGSQVPRALADRLRQRLTDDVLLTYACTEAALVAIATLDMIEAEPRAAGYPRPNVEVRTVDEDGRVLPQGKVGRLAFRSAGRSIGYIDDPELTSEVYRDGWFISRDLGCVRKDGLLLLEGRVDEVMNLGGHKVQPARVEEAALRCPGVRDAAAFATRSESGLDHCSLAVVTDGEVDVDVITEAVRGCLMLSQKLEITKVDAIPRNEMGKIDRERLRQTRATIATR